MARTSEQTETAPEPTPTDDRRFFAWMRSLDVPRQPGWIGGVCAGIAARLGIDPLIVRGIVVVVAVLGGPALILYAAAWLLLPDQNNKIHLEQLIAGKLESPIAGIGALVLLSLLPLTQGFWYAGATYWGEPSWGNSVGRVLWTIVVLGLIVWFVIWIARRAGRGSMTPTVSPATTDARPDTIPEPLPDDIAAFTAVPPAPPPAGAPAEELTAWREQQAAWRAEREQFRRQEAEAQRELRRHRAAEARDRARASAAQAAERHRQHRAANPGLSAAVVFTAIGGTVVAGGIATIVASTMPALEGYEVTTGLAVSAGVLGLVIVAAGALRRRSGILGFLAVVALIGSLGSALVPPGRQLVPPVDYGVGTGEYTQLFGGLEVLVHQGSRGGVTDIWQGSGTVRIRVLEGMAARIEVVSRSGNVNLWQMTAIGTSVYEMRPQTIAGDALPSGDRQWDVTVGDETAAELRTIRIWQGRGGIEIYDEDKPTDEGADQ